MNFKKLLFGTGLLGTIKIVTMISGLIQSVVLAHFLSVDNYAAYGQCTTLISTISGITIFGFADAVLYYCGIAKDEAEKRKYLSIIFIFETAFCILSGILIFSLKDAVAQLFNSEAIGSYILLLAFFPLLVNVFTCLSQLLFTENKVKWIAVGNLGFSFLSLAISIVIINNNKPILLYLLLMIGLYVLSIMFNLFAYLLGKKRFIKLSSFNKNDLLEVLKYTIPLGLAIIGSTLLKEFDKIIISNRCSELDFATYSAVSRQLPVTFFSAALGAQIAPLLVKEISSKNFDKVKKLLHLYFLVGFVTSVVLGLGIFSVSKQALLFLYSDKYVNGIWVFIIYIFVDVATFIYPGKLLMISGRTKELLLHSLLMVVLNIVLNVILLQVIGIIGPAIATLIVQILALLVQTFRGLKTNHLSIKEYVPWSNLVVCALLCIPATVVFTLLAVYFPIQQIADLFVYGGSCVLVNGFLCFVYLRRSINNFKEIETRRLD